MGDIGSIRGVNTQSVRMSNAPQVGGMKGSYDPGPQGAIRAPSGRQDGNKEQQHSCRCKDFYERGAA
jgi:hypothetical protein